MNLTVKLPIYPVLHTFLNKEEHTTATISCQGNFLYKDKGIFEASTGTMVSVQIIGNI